MGAIGFELGRCLPGLLGTCSQALRGFLYLSNLIKNACKLCVVAAAEPNQTSDAYRLDEDLIGNRKRTDYRARSNTR